MRTGVFVVGSVIAMLAAAAPAFAASADIGVSEAAFPATVSEESGTLNHPVDFTNNGPDTSDGSFAFTVGPAPVKAVALTLLPGGSVSSASVSLSQGFTVTGTYSGLTSGSVLRVTMVYSTSHPLVANTSAQVTPTTPDPNASNNSAGPETTSITGLSLSDGGFGVLPVGSSRTKTLTVTNDSTTTVTMGSEVLGGLHAGDFSIPGHGTCTGSLAPGGTCTFDASFTPSAPGERSATVTVAPGDGPIDPVTGTLSGSGTTAPRPQPPLPDTTHPTLTLSGVPRVMKLRALKRKGLRFTVAASEPVSLTAQLFAVARSATLTRGKSVAAPIYNLELAHSIQSLDSGSRVLRLRPSRKLLRKSKRFKLQLAVRGTDAAGNSTTATRTIKVR